MTTPSKIFQLFVVLFFSTMLTSCAVVDKGLEMVGLKSEDLPKVDPETKDSLLAKLEAFDKKVPLRIHGGENMNVDSQGRSLSVVVKVYKLKSTDAFLAEPITSFSSAAAEKAAAFQTDVVSAREFVLPPGQVQETIETMPGGVPYLGVVALFRSPSEGRWKFAFDAEPSMKSGITVGLHACAMSVAAGSTVGTSPDLLRVAGVRCK